MYANVASNNIKLLKDELTVTFDPSRLAARFNTVKAPTNQDLTPLILAVVDVLSPHLAFQILQQTNQQWTLILFPLLIVTSPMNTLEN